MRERAQALGFAATALLIGSMLTACAGGQGTVQSTPAAAKSNSVSGPQASGPSFPVANPGGKVDDASQHKADTWLDGAVVPPEAVRSHTRPAGVADGATPEMWCDPMADAVGYWTVPDLSADDALTWLNSHPSQGMQVTGGSSNPHAGDQTNVGGTVVDEPSHMSLEALIFTVTPIGSGSGIRADAFTKATNSVCATPPPGTALGIGG